MSTSTASSHDFWPRPTSTEEAFRNLVAEETKTIEVFDASGKVEKRRQIVSDLLAYRSPRDGRATTEYRDVRVVDGKVIEHRRERAMKLLTRASSEKSLEKELEAINRETYRYEFRRHLRGYTIGQSVVLKRHRAAFHVETVGREQMDGRDVVVLDYPDGPGGWHSAVFAEGVREPAASSSGPALA